MRLPQITSTLGVPGTYATLVVWRWDRETPDLVPQRIVMRGRTVYDVQTQPTEVPFGRLPPRADVDREPSRPGDTC